MGTPTLHLYLDDSGTRCPFKGTKIRNDGLDHFALGGLLLKSEDLDRLNAMHAEVCGRRGIEYPLHSSSIRSKKKDFRWMEDEPLKASNLMEDLGKLICELPAHIIACVVHRPGYNARYGSAYGKQRWMLCKTAYSIVVERAAKFAIQANRRLLVHVELTNKVEDRMVKEYHSKLRNEGMYFDPGRSEKYTPLGPNEFEAILFKEPKFFDKDNAAGQLSDLALYPVVKGRYDPSYRPYRELKEAGRLVDALLRPEDAGTLGIKYSCFEAM
jgi:hypothetical protein